METPILTLPEVSATPVTVEVTAGNAVEPAVEPAVPASDPAPTVEPAAELAVEPAVEPVEKPAEEPAVPARAKKEKEGTTMLKSEAKALLKEIKLPGTARVDETKTKKASWNALAAKGYVEKGPRGLWYISPKAAVTWSDLFDFEASPKYAARMKAVRAGENGTNGAKALRKAKVAVAATVEPKKRGRKPKAATVAVATLAVKGKGGRPKNVQAAVNKHMAKAQKGLKYLIEGMNAVALLTASGAK